MSRAVTVADCERVQADWYRLRATHLGAGISQDGPLTWLSGPDELSLMFPTELPADALARGVATARDRGVSIGVWLGLDVDAAPLAAAGFERGWSPWWMAARLADVGPAADDRARLREDSTDYGDEHAAYRAELALARLRPRRSWYAAAYATGGRLARADPSGGRLAAADPSGGRFAGHAWAHRVDELAGVFDMAVWPPFRRQGLGTALLRTVCAAAGAAGATHTVLNATEEGALLYRRRGFTRLGEGITWWWHPER